jgi:hypothetical protein
LSTTGGLVRRKATKLTYFHPQDALLEAELSTRYGAKQFDLIGLFVKPCSELYIRFPDSFGTSVDTVTE